MKTNQYRNYIQLYKPIRTEDDYGQTALLYTPVKGLIPSKLTVKSAKESFITDKLVSTYNYEYVIRYVTWITADFIIKYEGNYYSIQSVVDKEGTRKELIISSTIASNFQGVLE